MKYFHINVLGNEKNIKNILRTHNSPSLWLFNTMVLYEPSNRNELIVAEALYIKTMSRILSLV